MKKMINNVKISGRVYDHNLAVKTTGATSKKPGTQYINGTLDVATDDDCLNIVTINFTYVTPTTSKNTKSSTYSNLNEIIEKNKTILAVGKDAATMVSITGSIGLNEFYSSRNGSEELVSAKRIEGSFVNIVKGLSKLETDRNCFECDMLINGIRQVEANPEKNIDEDYLVIKGAVFNFRNEILPIEFNIKGKGGINYFESLEASSKNLVFTKVWGKINCQNIVIKKTIESAFGEPIVKEYERKDKEWLVTGANPEIYPLGDEDSLTAEEITKMLADREVHLADIKKRAEDYKNNQVAATTNNNVISNDKLVEAAAGAFNF